MRSRIDARLNRGSRAKKPTPPPGGKVLQRLMTFLGRRDPALNDAVVAGTAVPKAARLQFGLTSKALGAKPLTARSRPTGRTPSPAKALATAMSKAAAALGRPRRSRRRSSRAAAAGPAAPPAAWQFLGPSNIPNGQTYGTNRVDVIGRLSCIAIDPGNPKHLLVGAAGGGIWESADTGATWNPRTDQLPSLAIGAVTFDPTNPKRVYAGSGEGNFYFNLGAGVYRSMDGGTTWSVLAAAPFVGVGFFDLVVDRTEPKTLYAATTNGLYKSTNAGGTWSLKRPGQCWDISLHPNGGMVELLAAFANGLFVSTNGASSFAAVALPSAPAGPWDRLAVDRVAAAPDVAYVFGAAGGGRHLWRRAGTTWTKITNVPVALNVNQAWYDW